MTMPRDRYLMVHDLWPQADGSFRLRDGYTLMFEGLQPNVPIHSITSFLGAAPAYKPQIVFWQNETPYVWDGKNLNEATVRGTPIRSSSRWCYFTVKGDNGLTLHAFNGTDAKWFDNTAWRDIGLPKLTKDQGDNVGVSLGVQEISQSDATAVSLSFSSGGAWSPADTKGRFVYMSYFDPATNERSPASIPLGSGSPVLGTLNQKLDISGLPVSAFPKLLGLTPDGLSYAGWIYTSSKNVSAFSYNGHTVVVTCNAHGFSSGDVIYHRMASRTGSGMNFQYMPVLIAVSSPNQYYFNFEGPGSYNAPAIARKLMVVSPGGTTATVTNPDPISHVDYNSFFPFNSDPSGNPIAGIAASAIGGAQPGYLVYGSIYNPTTGHVGNRVQFGARLNNTGRANFKLANLPDLSGIDSEWVILLGRTSDGGEVPYAIINSDGTWATVPAGSTSYTITQSDTDGDSELPSRNFPPPGTLDYNDQIAPDVPVPATFSRAWQEGDRCCGAITGSPTVYRSGSAQDTREGTFVGIPEHSWDPIDIETFPVAQAITCGQSYNGESWVFSKQHSAALIELAGELQWQGPWNEGCVGQFAWTKGWKNLPFWLSGKKQLVSVDDTGPIVISDEYEAALLSKIGDEHLAETEVNYIRHPEKRVDVLRIHGRDVNNQPITIIHDFNLREASSPFGQGYMESFGGPLRGGIWITASNLVRANGVVQVILSAQPFSNAIVGAPIYIQTASDESFVGLFVITSVVNTPTTQTITWNQQGASATAVNADLLISPHDAVVLHPLTLNRVSGKVTASLPAAQIAVFIGENVVVEDADDPSFDGTFVVSDISNSPPSVSWLQQLLATSIIVSAGWDEFSSAFATFLGAVPPGAVVGGTVLIEGTTPELRGFWRITAVIPEVNQFIIQFTIPTQFDLQGSSNGGMGSFYDSSSGSDGITNVDQITLSVPTPTTEAVILDANEQEQVVSSAGDGRLYLLYDSGNDSGLEFTGEALGLIYLGPDRKATKWLEWYGDFNVEWFLSKKLGINFDVLKMTELGVGPVKGPAQGALTAGDDGQIGDSHWQVAIPEPEMEHAFLLMRLASHSADGTTDLNSPPHMPLESYGRIWLLSPLLGASRPK